MSRLSHSVKKTLASSPPPGLATAGCGTSISATPPDLANLFQQPVLRTPRSALMIWLLRPARLSFYIQSFGDARNYDCSASARSGLSSLQKPIALEAASCTGLVSCSMCAEHASQDTDRNATDSLGHSMSSGVAALAVLWTAEALLPQSWRAPKYAAHVEFAAQGLWVPFEAVTPPQSQTHSALDLPETRRPQQPRSLQADKPIFSCASLRS